MVTVLTNLKESGWVFRHPKRLHGVFNYLLYPAVLYEVLGQRCFCPNVLCSKEGIKFFQLKKKISN